MRFPQQFFSLSLLLVSGLLLAPEAAAQKVDGRYREFPAHGFEFKPLKDMTDVPVDQDFKAQGGIGKFDAGRPISVKSDGNVRLNIAPGLRILKIVPQAATTDGGGGGGLRGRVGTEQAAEESGKEYVSMLYGPALRKEEFKLVEPEVSTVKAKGIEGKREEIATYVVFDTGALDLVYDVYTFRLPDYKIIFVWDYPADQKLRKKWGKAVEKSMKTFRTNLDEIETSSVKSVNSESDYEDLLEFHENDVAQTPGWQLVETPSKQYLIKTNSDKKKDIDLVIKRLEASRALFEADFPPPEPITSISVVRVCDSEEDFHRYGDTSPGVAGWFNPRSEELVLYFGESGKDSTLSVMTHEGFHQYCHFLFNRSKAHRWFDEGHGDYYGAWKMKGKKLVPNEDMKGGLARTPEIKTMIREGTVKPLKKHIRFDHGQWQGQGPSNVSCYAQSFSIIYFLREGTRGKVKSKYWKDEYADIIPDYMKHLAEGYQDAYDEIRETAEEQIELLTEAGAEYELIESAKEAAERPWDFLHTLPGVRDEIWAKSMAESWGKIDELEFEERWLEFVMDEM